LYQTPGVEVVLHPARQLADHNYLQYKAKVVVVVHSPGLVEDKLVALVHSPDPVEDRAFAAAEEAILQVVEVELHRVRSAQKYSLDSAEMDQIHLAAEQFAQRMVRHIVGNVFRPELKPLHNYDRFDTGYS
jgi:hypothetical protein